MSIGKLDYKDLLDSTNGKMGSIIEEQIEEIFGPDCRISFSTIFVLYLLRRVEKLERKLEGLK